MGNAGKNIVSNEVENDDKAVLFFFDDKVKKKVKGEKEEKRKVSMIKCDIHNELIMNIINRKK